VLKTRKPVVAMLGKESAGKSTLAASLTGAYAYSANFRGSTLACESYDWDDFTLVDMPGIDSSADSEAAKDALERLAGADVALLVAPAMHLEEDLRDLLPLLTGRRAVVAVTFRDKELEAHPAALPAGLRAVHVDGRHVSAHERVSLLAGIASAQPIPARMEARPRGRASERVHHYVSWWAPLCALVLLLLPAIAVVMVTNRIAGAMEPLVQAWLKPAVEALASLPEAAAALLGGSYGLLTMGPLLLVWAAPVVLMYALLLAVYKASGLIDWISLAIDPAVRPFGLTGRDVPRILMGFGCNVPAVIGTRSCSAGGRNTCISAIAFGSACSYQFGATLAVFSACGRPGLVTPYLMYLAVTALAYSWWISRSSRPTDFRILTPERAFFLEWPRWRAVWREVRGSVGQFLVVALPVFLAITLAAAALSYIGVLDWLAESLRPVLSAFRIPGEAALAIVMGSVRKDGILLLGPLAAKERMTDVQILTAVYLAGVLLPCLVTALTIARERSWRFAARLAGRQALAASLFALLLAWTGALVSK